MEFYEAFKELVNKNITEDKTKEVFNCYMDVKLSEINDLSRCESPIEKILYISMKTFELGEDPFEILPQYTIEISNKNYRIDFVVCDCKSGIEIAVECDGHEYHEKDKKQAKKDKKRDRLLQKDFGAVMRFSGSEIYKKPHQCADEIFELICVKNKRMKSG